MFVVQSVSPVWLYVTPWTGACSAPLSMRFPRYGYWSGLPFPSPGYLSDPGIKPTSPAWQVDSLPFSHLGSPNFYVYGKPKHSCGLFFFVILLYCHDLEPNPWHLQGLHLLGSTVLNLGKSGLLFFQVFFFFLLLPSPVHIIFFGTPLPFRLTTWFVSQFSVFGFYFPVFFSPMFCFG